MEPPRENKLTEQQKAAVAARGNVLVMAGAGTGKTHTLVERCLNLICDERSSLDEILIVTFTEAAATEMKQRLRAALEKTLNSQPRGDSTLNSFLAEQLALFDTAHIGTLHGFCFKLVREHFHELGLDPQLAVLDEGEARLLAGEILDEQFDAHYEGEDDFSLAVQDLIKIYGNGRDEKIRALVLRLYHYLQTRAEAGQWLAEQIELFSSNEPLKWRDWFSNAISAWCNEWLPVLENLRRENIKAGECLEILQKFKSPESFPKILAADADWPPRKKTVLREPLKGLFAEAEFFNSLVANRKNDPLAEDWNWVRSHMKTLLLLAREFSEQFSARKRADGVLDFHDLEQSALKLLWDFESDQPTETARRWREKLRFVFVDEYQDINAAQDKIICALAREGERANRFLVGDVKQSIYRFRLADPKIFRDYANDWPVAPKRNEGGRGEKGQTIPLAENFRSRESLLNFVNSLFAPLMREDIGGVAYDEEARLKFGLSEKRTEFSLAKDAAPRTELLLRFTKGRNDLSDAENGNDDLADLEESEKEARLLALRLSELKNSRHEIWDDERKIFRPAEWRDMAILLRAPSGKAEIFAKQFARAGVPLLVERGGFFDSSEIQDLLSLLQLLDNPLQDVPCIAVLRSPLVGLSLDELAEIRLAAREKLFWTALNRFQLERGRLAHESTLSPRLEKFLERFSRWRRTAKLVSLSQCLEEILDETLYADWLKARPRGAQRAANVERFSHLAQKFDQFQRQGLFRFLKFIKAQREADVEPEVAPVAEENAVRLMSIHQSKGLEFPVVAVADLAKNFNTQDLRAEIILDEMFGLCPRVKPPKAGGRYPSLPHWLAQKNQRRELAGEELRLLYVALTRARDTLILTGSISEKKWETVWTAPGSISARQILSAKSYADWLGLWFAHNATDFNSAEGELPHLRWQIADDEAIAHRLSAIGHDSEASPASGNKLPILDGATANELRKTLSWQYPFGPATKRAAKSSVTALRREANVELDDEAEQWFRQPRMETGRRKLSAADAGLAHHKFLQHFDFAGVTDAKSLEAEAARLERENILSAAERNALSLKDIAAFWNSAIGKEIHSQSDFVRRELPFTARFSPAELDKILETTSGANLEKEFVIIQGVADLVVLSPKEIWLVDFKTDQIRANDLAGKIEIYSPQVKLYARALEKIYSRPVSRCWLHFLSAQKTEPIKT